MKFRPFLLTARLLIPLALSLHLHASDFIAETAPNAPLIRDYTLTMSAQARPTVVEFRRQGEKTPFTSLQIAPDATGRQFITSTRTPPSTKWENRIPFAFWPDAKDARSITMTRDLDLTESSWRDREFKGRIRYADQQIQVWLEGRLIFSTPWKENLALKVVPGKNSHFDWTPGDAMKGNFVPVPMGHLVTAPGKSKMITREGIPFEIAGPENVSTELPALSLGRAGWPEAKIDPKRYRENYDTGYLFFLVDQDRQPYAEVPKADYIAAYVLAVAEEKPETTNALTLRMGARSPLLSSSENSQVFYRDFQTKVPYGDTYSVIRIPLNEAFASDIEGPRMAIEITKELRLARSKPDPSRFRWRPLGLPSNVKIASITLEKSPIQMEVRPAESGALFEQPAPAKFNIKLTNTTTQSRRCTIKLAAGADPQEIKVDLPPGETVVTSADLATNTPGHHNLSVSLHDDAAGDLFTYHTSFGILPPDTRKHRESAPWGTWDFNGTHFTPSDPQATGEVMRKLGLRYGMFSASSEARQRFGVLKGNDPKVGGRSKEPSEAPAIYRAVKEQHPDQPENFMIFHEDAISGGHASRIPDLFHNRPAYTLNAAEKETFQHLWKVATEAATAMRRDFPNVKLHLGNGPIPLLEELFRHQLPADLFDAAGNESAGFGRPPETQPPDSISPNAALWMMRQMLDHYGYPEKSISQAYEVIYPGTNPGNLSLQTQSDYFIRHILHAMAWKIPIIRPGGIADVGNSYYHSNWGSSGFMYARPNWTPKPSAIALATLTRVLDGAEYKGFVETGSDSAYLLHFEKQDGAAIYPYWTLRGQRNFTLRVEGAPEITRVDQNGVSTRHPVQQGEVTLPSSASPAWLELPKGAAITNVSLAQPDHRNAEPTTGKVTLLSPLGTASDWQLEPKQNPLLEYYNPIAPRRKGDFVIEETPTFEDKGPSLKITPRSITLGKATVPMYAEWHAKKEITLPGTPTEIGLWINGNSGWGRLIVELEDASGQRWTSIGARSAGASAWMEDWLKNDSAANYQPGEIADWNTDDVFGLSRINFDGWRYVGIPLPGQYPGERYHWPANSQWRWDKDGIVHYPLKVKKLIVELPEKVLYLTRHEAPKRPEIYLHRLIAVEKEPIVKQTSPEYVEEAQVSVR